MTGGGTLSDGGKFGGGGSQGRERDRISRLRMTPRRRTRKRRACAIRPFGGAHSFRYAAEVQRILATCCDIAAGTMCGFLPGGLPLPDSSPFGDRLTNRPASRQRAAWRVSE